MLHCLYRSDFDASLTNVFRMLKPGGRFRLIVSDLEARVQRYLDAKAAGVAHASDQLIRECHILMESAPKSISGRLRAAFGHSGARWMWDYEGFQAALSAVGFVEIRRAQMGDSGDPMLAQVEQESRFFDKLLGIPECAIECRKPQQKDT
jgi:hypothetical protein